MPGVTKVVAIDGNAVVVVVADTYWNARTALAALPTDWDIGKLGEVQTETINAMLKEGLDAGRSLRRQQGTATPRPRSTARPRRSPRPTASSTSTTSPWSR